MKIWIEADSAAICRAAARALVQLVSDGDETRIYHVALAGGSTPKALYELLATDEFSQKLPWSRIHIYFGDERSVGPDHLDSNFRMAQQALLSQVAIPESNVHRMVGEAQDVGASAADYAVLLDQHLPKDDAGVPQFDLVMLGLGPDGHIASLFPDTDILHQDQRWADAVWVEKFKTWRISITYPLINHARQVWMFVAGESKAQIISEVLGDKAVEPRYPVQAIDAKGQLTWFLDDAAAALLSKD